MKKIITLLLAVLVLSLMLCGCGDKDHNEETAQLPVPSGATQGNEENAPSNEQDPDADTRQGTGPADPIAPIQTAEGEPAPSQAGQSEAPTETDAAPAQTTESLGGLDVEEEYTVEVGPNQGVGGN